MNRRARRLTLRVADELARTVVWATRAADVNCRIVAAARVFEERCDRVARKERAGPARLEGVAIVNTALVL